MRRNSALNICFVKQLKYFYVFLMKFNHFGQAIKSTSLNQFASLQEIIRLQPTTTSFRLQKWLHMTGHIKNNRRRSFFRLALVIICNQKKQFSITGYSI